MMSIIIVIIVIVIIIIIIIIIIIVTATPAQPSFRLDRALRSWLRGRPAQPRLPRPKCLAEESCAWCLACETHQSANGDSQFELRNLQNAVCR